jgi:hypothetical protein
MKWFLFLLLQGCLVSHISAAEENHAKPVRGEDALLLKAGDPAAWAATSQPAEGANPVPPSRRQLTKSTGKRIGERSVHIVTYSNGDEEIFWRARGVVVLKRSGSPTYFVMPHFNEERPDIDFGTSDFPELLWVRSSNSSGVMEVNGIKCYVFSRESKGVVQETAFVAVETKLPVRRTLGGLVFDYQYSNKPEAIQYPPELLAEVEVFFQHQTKTHRPISKP